MTRDEAMADNNGMNRENRLPEVEPVRLEPVRGIRPGVFILAGLIVLIVLLFFLICMLPGIVSGTGYVRFETNTADTAIYADGRYIGSSEGSVYRLPAGDTEFSFYVSGVYAGSVEAHIPHRIFFTAFVHRTDTISFEASYSEEIEEAASEHLASEAAAWSAVISYDESYHFPPIFSSYAENAAALGFRNVSDPLLYAAMHITSETMHEDFLKAVSILDEAGIDYRTPELEGLIATLDGIYSGSASATPDEAAVPETPSYDGRFYSYSGGMTAMGDSTSLSYPASNRAPVSVETPPFSIAGRPVTEYEYALFTEEVPYWSKENKETLIADGMADEGYLDGIMLSSAVMSSRPVRCISWYAASAYCDWYSEKTGKEYSLPTEAEWYRAALSAAGKPYVTTLVHIDGDQSSPSAMMGQLWEFTSTPYVPLMRIGDYGKALELASAYPYDDIIVKGGSYVNDPSSVTIESVGVMDRAATSPYAGFRIVGR